MAKMTLDESGRKYLVETGLEPVGNRAILVEYAPNDNLGDKLAHFFGSEPYILQMCRNELVLIPMHMNVSCGTVAYYSLENKVALQLSYASVQSGRQKNTFWECGQKMYTMQQNERKAQ